jgi:hypothetical protein
MLFDQKHKKKVSVIWAIVCILVAISMVALYIPILRY